MSTNTGKKKLNDNLKTHAELMYNVTEIMNGATEKAILYGAGIEKPKGIICSPCLAHKIRSDDALRRLIKDIEAAPRRRWVRKGWGPQEWRQQMAAFIRRILNTPPGLLLACTATLAGGWGVLVLFIVAFG